MCAGCDGCDEVYSFLGSASADVDDFESGVMDLLVPGDIDLVLDKYDAVFECGRDAGFVVLVEDGIFQLGRAADTCGDAVDMSEGIGQPGIEVAEFDAGDVFA